MTEPEEDALKIEPHYTAKQIAQRLGWSPDAIRKLFRDEPGVVSITGKLGKHKDIRVPASVFERVYRRMQNAPLTKEKKNG